MTNVNLTQNEITALMTCLNYETRAGQLSDNYSNGGQEEFKAALDWNDKQVAALIGSLESKGMGYGDHNEGNGHIFWLSEEAVNILFDIIEADKKEEKDVAALVGTLDASKIEVLTADAPLSDLPTEVVEASIATASETAVGDRLTWCSAKGILNGTVTKIARGETAANTMIDWMLVQVDDSKGSPLYMPMTQDYFVMMNLYKI